MYKTEIQNCQKHVIGRIASIQYPNEPEFLHRSQPKYFYVPIVSHHTDILMIFLCFMLL